MSTPTTAVAAAVPHYNPHQQQPHQQHYPFQHHHQPSHAHAHPLSSHAHYPSPYEYSHHSQNHRLPQNPPHPPHHLLSHDNPVLPCDYQHQFDASVLHQPPPTTTIASPSPYHAGVATQNFIASPSTPLFPLYLPQNLAAPALSPSDGVTHDQLPPCPPPHVYFQQPPAGHHHPNQQNHHNNNPAAATASASAPYHDDFLPGMASTTVTATAPAASPMSSNAAVLPPADQPSRKRRRSRDPDWNNFYRNGLPQEVIVIDDSPEPSATAARKQANGYTAAARPLPALPTQHGLPESQVPAAKRRRRDDAASTTSSAAYHIQYAQPSHTGTPIGSTLSSDGNSSAVHTTAPTSLSSNGHYEEATTAPLKRKRTRQQAAIEAKRRDIEGLGHAFLPYEPPPRVPKKAGDVHVRVVHDSLHNKHIKVDDDDGHYIVVPDADLTEHYQIQRLLGQGTFGKVVQARDRRRNKDVAVKIIRSVQKYRDASRIELRVLATLKANDEANRNRCIHIRDCFDYKGHICIVMDLLGQSVFDFLKGNSFVPFPNSQIQSFARQLLTSVAFLHDLNLIHTDLKPENILLYDNSYQTFTYNRKIPSSSTTVNRSSPHRRVLLDTETRLIDFGSATFEDEYHSSVVSTRHYRAPEIILGLGWSYPCDIWSIGCILVEFFTGDALFQTHDNLEHLAMMEAVIGRRIDSHLVQSVNKMSTRSSGNPASKYFKRLKLDYPTADTTRGSRRFVKAMKNLDDVIPKNSNFFKNFHDLLRKIFVYDPAYRITAKEALNHPWFKEMAPPDDGTEAAKIRLEKRRSMATAGRNPRAAA